MTDRKQYITPKRTQTAKGKDTPPGFPHKDQLTKFREAIAKAIPSTTAQYSGDYVIARVAEPLLKAIEYREARIQRMLSTMQQNSNESRRTK